MEQYTRKHEKALFRQAQAGDRESLETLMQRHERLVHAVVRRQWSGGWRYQDIVHEGRIGLWRALLNYDPEYGTAFSTYAWPAIARQVWRAVQQAGQAAEVSGPRGEPHSEDVARQVARREIAHTLRETVARLPAKERWVLARHYGLDGRGGTTYQRLGEWLGCTRQAISYHESKALRRLRHPGWSAKLRAQLGYDQRQDYHAALTGQTGGAA
jgi:RNA polymerase sigma factor (sigma-70 family)